jgi:hypothetical protein
MKKKTFWQRWQALIEEANEKDKAQPIGSGFGGFLPFLADFFLDCISPQLRSFLINCSFGIVTWCISVKVFHPFGKCCCNNRSLSMAFGCGSLDCWSKGFEIYFMRITFWAVDPTAFLFFPLPGS